MTGCPRRRATSSTARAAPCPATSSCSRSRRGGGQGMGGESMPGAAVAVTLLLGAWGGGWGVVRARRMDRWLPAYIAGRARRHGPAPGEEVHLILCVADPFEPKYGGAGPEQ